MQRTRRSLGAGRRDDGGRSDEFGGFFRFEEDGGEFLDFFVRVLGEVAAICVRHGGRWLWCGWGYKVAVVKGVEV